VAEVLRRPAEVVGLALERAGVGGQAFGLGEELPELFRRGRLGDGRLKAPVMRSRRHRMRAFRFSETILGMDFSEL